MAEVEEGCWELGTSYEGYQPKFSNLARGNAGIGADIDMFYRTLRSSRQWQLASNEPSR
jgi:hypothetical protein